MTELSEIGLTVLTQNTVNEITCKNRVIVDYENRKIKIIIPYFVGPFADKFIAQLKPAGVQVELKRSWFIWIFFKNGVVG